MHRTVLLAAAFAVAMLPAPAPAQRGPELREIGAWRVEIDRSVPPVNQCTLRLVRPGADGLRFAIGYDRGERVPWIRLVNQRWRLRAGAEGRLELVFRQAGNDTTWRVPYAAIDRDDIAVMMRVPAADQAEFWGDFRQARSLTVRIPGTGEYSVDLSARGGAADAFDACRAEAERAGPIPGMPRPR